MASKLLASYTTGSAVSYCVPCGNALAEADADEPVRLVHDSAVGEQVCAGCGARIADLPEPPLLDFSIGQAVTMRVSLQASSLPEALQLAFDALQVDGLLDCEFTSHDSWPL